MEWEPAERVQKNENGDLRALIGGAWVPVTNAQKSDSGEFRVMRANAGYDVPAGVASAMNIGQAVTFGFGDEIASKAGFDKERYNATIDQFRKEYPGSAMLGSISGSMLIPGAAGKMFASAPYAAAATTGLGMGALQGAGDAPSMQDIPNDAAVAGLGGLAAAPAMLFGGTLGANAVRSAGTKLPFIGNKLSEEFARNQVVRSFMRDSTDAEQVGRRMVELGPEARIADAAGQNTRNMLDLNASMPGKTSDQIESVIRNRIRTRPDRMDQVVYAVNNGAGRAGDISAALERQQRAVAGPLYAKAHAENITPSAQLTRDLEAARQLGAFSEARKRALANPDDGGPFSLDDAQQYLGGGQIAIRDIDRIKQGLDSLIDGQTDAMTGKVTGYGRDLVALKKRILGEINSPTYDAARQAFAGPAALKTAISKGRAFWNDDAESIGTMMQGMSDGEKEAFRVGAAEALRTMVGGQTGQNRLLNAWKDRNVREKLQQLLGDDVKYAQVQRWLDNEATLKRMEGLGSARNSKTAVRGMGAEDQAMTFAQDAVNAKLNPTGAIGAIMSRYKTGTPLTGTPEKVRDKIGEILLDQYMPENLKALMVAQEVLKRQQSQAAAASGVAGSKSAYEFLKK